MLTLPPSSTTALVVDGGDEDPTAVLARHGKSFRFAGAFLSKAKLHHAAVVYAFCREVDDAVDEAPSLAEARAAADDLQRELHGEADARPAVARFLEVCRQDNIDVGFAEELVRGVQGDAEPEVLVDDDETLLRYCYRVAGTVGGLMCGVLDVRDPKALPFAVDLGVGMQLTNICRDVLEDAHRSRRYVPKARLEAHGGTGALPALADPGAQERAAVVATVRDLLALAERYYRSGEAGLHFIPWRSRLAILIAGRVYRAIGRLLLARGGDPMNGRTSTSTARKIWVAMGAVVAFPFLPRRRIHDASLHQALCGLPGTNAAAPETTHPAR